MKTIIKLRIERFEEQGQEYFVATSDDIQGLVAEGNTVEEAVAIAEDSCSSSFRTRSRERKCYNKFSSNATTV